MLFFFFFLCNGTYRHLHSFPTRRSSDLAPASRNLYAITQASIHGRPRADAAAARRSEEHTSELQSRRDLVCRLLLEKKKSGSAGMPRAISYAVFCLIKKKIGKSPASELS